ncbi:MAG: type II toxin-antitoxin system MqsA family antitoxin [Candidatus Binatia bacterium]
MRPCFLCKQWDVVAEGQRAAVTLEGGSAAVTIRNVAAMICQSCGEKYFDEATTARLQDIANSLFSAGVDFPVCDYEAKAAA